MAKKEDKAKAKARSAPPCKGCNGNGWCGKEPCWCDAGTEVFQRVSKATPQLWKNHRRLSAPK